MNRLLAWVFWPKSQMLIFSGIEPAALLLTNVAPIFGVLFFQWNAFPILVLYLAEIDIVLFFDLIGVSQDETARFPAIAAMSGYFINFFIFGLSQLLLVAFVLEMSDRRQALESIQDIFFVITAMLFLGNQVVLRVVRSRKRKRRVLDFKSRDMLGVRYFFKLGLSVALVGIVLATKSYAPYLMALVAVKTFLDLRSHLRQQNSSERSQMRRPKGNSASQK